MKKFLEIIKKYKERNCKTFFGTALQMLIFHHITRLIFFMILAITGALGIQYGDSSAVIWNILFYSGLIYLAIFALFVIIFVCIINPIRSLKEK
jgi:hypothetical protein